jgi:diaminopropionate ammonia-lyase
MHGYGVMASEIVHQLSSKQPPTHVFVQAGVGALAAAVCANFWLQWGSQRPLFIVTEPTQADCVFKSLQAGQRTAVQGALDTVMAGLACGEVSELAWEILQGGTNFAVKIDDAYALDAMRTLARPIGNDPAIVAGETGGVGLAALLAARDHPGIRAQLKLDASSRVLLLGSEGDTDPVIYKQVVGQTAVEVLA